MVLQYFTLENKIVKDSLEAILNSKKNEKLVIVGGMAVQFYCNDPRLRRPTSDVDILLKPNMSFEEFINGFGKKIQEYIIRKKYQCQLKRARSANEVKIMDGQHNKAKQLFFIHFTRYSDEFLQKYDSISERELTHANELTIPDLDLRVYVKRIEDIIPHKLNRLKKYIELLEDPLKKTLVYSAEESDWDALAKFKGNLYKWNEEITLLQSKLEKEPQDRLTQACYIVNKDLYDIIILSIRIVLDKENFNFEYYISAKEEIKKKRVSLL